MDKFRIVAIGLVATVAAGACGDGDVEPPTEWSGMATHLMAVGTLQGEHFELVLSEEEASAPGTLTCIRQYVVPSVEDTTTWRDGRLASIEIVARVVRGGIEREYELEIEAANFATTSTPADIPVVMPGATEVMPPAGSSWFEIQYQWEEGDAFVDFEAAADEGALDLEVLSGEPGADGLVIPAGEGQAGGFFDVAWTSGDWLAGTFTAECINDIDIP